MSANAFHGLPPALEGLLDRLVDVRRSGNGYSARCPAHDDDRPSLTIGLGDDGRVLVRCHAGCAFEAVVEAVGLQARDLAPLGQGRGRPRQRRTPRPKPSGNGVRAYASAEDAAEAVAKATGLEVVSAFDYLDAGGHHVMTVVRLEPAGGGEKTFRPIAREGEKWRIGSLPGALPLYLLPQIANAPQVFVVEGEGCVDLMRWLGFETTTSAHGAASAAKTDWSPLAGKEISILPDNDQAGRRYACDVGDILRRLDPPAKIAVLELPGLPEGGDIVDWYNAKLAEGLEKGEVAEELARLLEGAEREASFVRFARFARGGDPSEWASPEPICDRVVLPPFPIETAFPGHLARLRDFVLAATETYQVPVDAVAMLLLPIIALPLSKRYEVEPQPGWREQLSIYVLVLLPSGERKTAIIRCLLSPVYAWQRDKATGLAAALAHFDNEFFVAEAKLRRARSLSVKGEVPADDQDALARHLLELEQTKPRTPRLIATEGTSEAIALMLVENGERGIVAAAEGDALDVMLGRYSGSPNFGVWLSGHSGDAVDSIRRGRSNDHLVHPALQVALCVQPQAALDLIGSRAAEGRGLLARMFFSLPESKVGYRKMVPPPMPTELLDYYGTRVQSHLDKPIPTEPALIRLSPEAGELLLRFREQNEIDLRPEGALSLARAWGSKLPGGLVRIAGILTAFEHRDVIDAETMQCALAFAPYLTSHYEHIASLAGVDDCVEVARRIDRWILTKGRCAFSRREAFTAVRSARVQRVGDIDGALELLQARNRIRQLPAEGEGKPGRPAGPTFQVNPALLSPSAAPPAQNAQNAQNSTEEGA